MIDKNLSEFIRALSAADTKTLSQRGLKTTEEVGELAKKILPYENASGTQHRVVASENILEEVADVTLCVLSIAHQLGFTDEQIVAEIQRKAGKWSELQKKEGKATFPLPFEIHVTVDLSNLEANERYNPLDVFRGVCKKIGVKPIILDLQNKEGTSVMADVMTSSKHFGTNTSALQEALRISYALVDHGFKVVRHKLETVPWHPAAPQTPWDKMPQHCYFEAHIPVQLTEDRIPELTRFVQDICTVSVHMSRNVFKKMEDGRVVVMLTVRDYDICAPDFEWNVSQVTRQLTASGFEYGKVHTEFALYDSKVHHDATWLQ